jgi:hypothetical protein
LNLDLGDCTDTSGIDDGKSKVVWSTTVTEPDVNVTWCWARYTLVADGNDTGTEGTVSLETTHGNIGKIHVMRVFGDWAPILEVDFTAMVQSGTTAPFRVCVAGAGIDNLKSDGVRVSGFAYGVIGSVGLSLDQLKTLTAGEIVVKNVVEPWPELCVVVSVGCSKVATESGS